MCASYIGVLQDPIIMRGRLNIKNTFINCRSIRAVLFRNFTWLVGMWARSKDVVAMKDVDNCGRLKDMGCSKQHPF